MPDATLDDYHNVIQSQISAALDSSVNVDAYSSDFRGISSSAVLISLDKMQWDISLEGGEGMPMSCEWSVYCLVPKSTPNAELDVRKFALEVSRVIFRGQRFGFDNIAKIEDIFAMPSVFEPDVDKYECWVVGFDQLIEINNLYKDQVLEPFITFSADHEIKQDAPVAKDSITLPQN